ncbi:MAG: energy-coupling factor ABC transporter ATP-binding protein [Candidatus Limnocylindrales bacterium]
MTLRLDAVSYRYAGSGGVVLQDVDLTVELGEVVGLVGANEAGKSTLCLVAAGLAPGTIGGHLGGTVSIDHLTTARARPFELAQHCGSLFQNPATQISGTAPTVWEEVAFGPRNLGVSVAEVVRRVGDAIEALGIGTLVERDPARLSGGQAQLVALAGVLALRPTYLVLDEPTSQHHPQGTRLVGDALAALARQGGDGFLVV